MSTATAPAIDPAQRFQRVCEILDRHHRDPAALVPILQEVQAVYRYLPRDVMSYLATALGVSPAQVFGVATFYAHFTLEPKGKHVLRLCDGTACHVKESIPILEALRERLGLGEGRNTTPDQLFTIETVACLGACGLAPVMVLDDEVYGQQTPESALAVLDQVIAAEQEAKP